MMGRDNSIVRVVLLTLLTTTTLCHTAGGADFFEADIFGYEFQERQYLIFSPNEIVRNGNGNPLVFEANLGPTLPIFLIRGHKDRWDVNPLEKVSHEIRFLYNFTTYVRMLNAESKPVVTPSYISSFRLQWLGRRMLPGKNEGEKNKPRSEFRFGATLSPWVHHSNGQDGCTFLADPAFTSPECPGREEAIALNEQNGSFSTNYLALALHIRGSWGFWECRGLISCTRFVGIE